MIDMKRVMDISLSAIALAVLSPVLAFVALAVKIDSKGPALFGHERVGKNFVPFKVWKFRTMATGSAGPQITSGNDSRITRVGRHLRTSKIDELPQLYNVLRGDMSLVGPRPEVAEYVEMFRSEYEGILSVRPGLTDPASIYFRDEQAILANSPDPAQTYTADILPRKLELSAAYVDHRTAAMDWKVIFQTLMIVVAKR